MSEQGGTQAGIHKISEASKECVCNEKDEADLINCCLLWACIQMMVEFRSESKKILPMTFECRRHLSTGYCDTCDKILSMNRDSLCNLLHRINARFDEILDTIFRRWSKDLGISVASRMWRTEGTPTPDELLSRSTCVTEVLGNVFQTF